MIPPTTEQWLDIAAGYFEKSQFPNCVGAVDGKHIRIECPQKIGKLYYNYKNFFSIILMGICDSNYCFRVIDIGSYGKESDCNIIKQSSFDVKEKKGVGNALSEAKNVREYFVKYVNKPEFSLSWQNKVVE
ncbi:unnamed protein product [Macrosiphum euphorbiae]|uniref:DDE Tnp4 domain-containing protein n=1 Tax=Macrosiphum euphorbiae TaxID=13131 RepID=A0AAV0X3T1_9HEMI|nr:unnamed protein product [Macrosiphum euphorbiae]